MIPGWAIPARASRIISAPMKAHLGIDGESGLMPSVATTTANVADITVTDTLLHGEEVVYTGAEKREELKNLEVKWHIATQCVTIPALLPEGPLKGRARSRVEPVFQIIKYRFHHRKLRYLGLKKNGAQYEVLFALADLVMPNPPCWPPEAAFAPKIGAHGSWPIRGPK